MDSAEKMLREEIHHLRFTVRMLQARLRIMQEMAVDGCLYAPEHPEGGVYECAVDNPCALCQLRQKVAKLEAELDQSRLTWGDLMS